jgi:catechol 2,3-dioxygenase-like lactoylglutathione lyase family enzyme
MRGVALLVGSAIFAACALAQTGPPEKPRILGIDHVSFYTTQPDGVKKLYGGTLGLTSTAPIEPGLVRYVVGKQWIGYSAAPDPKGNDRMDHVAFVTDNITSLRNYLSKSGVKVPAIVGRADHSLSFTIKDPEGYSIEFVERGKAEPYSSSADSMVSHRMIHVGFLVRSREVEDHFYRDLLGFRLYWHGGMQSGETDWVAMQVPDGTDWLEYMLNQPEHPDLRLMGVMNHISLGVADMKKAETILESHGWKPQGEEKAQKGKDGKWQLNLFDPDLSRIELMEFKPVEKPCCADFTGPHPSE